MVFICTTQEGKVTEIFILSVYTYVRNKLTKEEARSELYKIKLLIGKIPSMRDILFLRKKGYDFYSYGQISRPFNNSYNEAIKFSFGSYSKSSEKSKTKVQCCGCNKHFLKLDSNIKRFPTHFCTQECYYKYQTKDTKNIPCEWCKQPRARAYSPSEQIKNDHFFCSFSCSMHWKNRHLNMRSHKRSKVEIWFFNRITEDYPQLSVLPSDKSQVGYELDIWIPELRLAVEINGPVHYEPIYGETEFKRIKRNDKNKTTLCYEKGIELIVVDCSHIKYMKESRLESTYQGFKHIIDKCLRRI